MEVYVELIVKRMNSEDSEQQIIDAITELEGIHDIEVNIFHERVKIEYDNEDISLKEICQVIIALGYEIVQ